MMCILCALWTVWPVLLLSHTVLSELYQQTLVAETDLEMSKGEGSYLASRIYKVLHSTLPEVMTSAVDVHIIQIGTQ